MLAAERTFLAWIRTSLALISLGFVVAKFGVWLNAMAHQNQSTSQMKSLEFSVPLGLAMMALGAILAGLSAWHFRTTSRAIEKGEFAPNTGLVVTVTIFVVALAVAMGIEMGLTGFRPSR